MVNCHKFSRMRGSLIKSGLLISSVLAFNSLFAQSTPDTIKRNDPDGWVFMQVRKDGYVAAEGNTHKGIQEGVWSSYWSTGYPNQMVTYLHGKKDGLAMRMLEEGILDYVEHYKNDKLEGPRRTFHIRGPIYEETYYSDGKKNGKYTKWYKNGRKQEEGAYMNDIREGLSTWYYESGKKAAEYTYEKGEMNGDAVSFYESSQISETGKYKNSEKTGWWKEYYENGIIKTEGKYVNNEKEGPWKQFDEKGNYLKTTTYSKGEEVNKK